MLVSVDRTLVRARGEPTTRRVYANLGFRSADAPLSRWRRLKLGGCWMALSQESFFPDCPYTDLV